jgi:hypothetical protein
VGEVAPDVCLGDTAAEYPLGEPAVEITFGVAVGVRRGVIYGVMENLCAEYLEAIGQKKRNEYASLRIIYDSQKEPNTFPICIINFVCRNGLISRNKAEFCK